MVTSYAVQRPDKKWAVMLVNRDQETAHSVSISFRDSAAGRSSQFSGNVDVITFGKGQYVWHPSIVSPMSHPEVPGQTVSISGVGHADPDGPLKKSTLDASSNTQFEVPAASIMVVRGEITAAR